MFVVLFVYCWDCSSEPIRSRESVIEIYLLFSLARGELLLRTAASCSLKVIFEIELLRFMSGMPFFPIRKYELVFQIKMQNSQREGNVWAKNCIFDRRFLHFHSPHCVCFKFWFVQAHFHVCETGLFTIFLRCKYVVKYSARTVVWQRAFFSLILCCIICCGKLVESDQKLCAFFRRNRTVKGMQIHGRLFVWFTLHPFRCEQWTTELQAS